MATVVWRRFNNAYRLTVADSPDGLRAARGLVALTGETIRPGRVQAVRMVEPLLWRPFGWCRLEVDVAGKQQREGEGAVEGRELRSVLPVGSKAVALEMLERILPGTPVERCAGAAARALEEPAALSQPLVGRQRPLRRDDQRADPARHRLGAAREGPERAPHRGPGRSGGCGS